MSSRAAKSRCLISFWVFVAIVTSAPKPGGQFSSEIMRTWTVATDGTYEVVAVCCHARDYGIHKISFDGHAAEPVDFFGTDIHWEKHTLGVFKLSKGEAIMTIACQGHRAEALPANMFQGMRER